VQIKVRFADFQTIVRAKTLAEPTDITGEIRRTAAELLETCLATAQQRIRLLGVGVSGFDGHQQVQPSLFPDEEREKASQLDRAADEIRERFGSAALHRGSGLLHGAEHKPAPRPK
jgi:DNA polymerase-4